MLALYVGLFSRRRLARSIIESCADIREDAETGSDTAPRRSKSPQTRAIAIEAAANSNAIWDRNAAYDQKDDPTMRSISPYLLPILLLAGSNIFMTFAWYGHLRFKQSPLLLVILVSWGIALLEYCMAVPANRWGSAVYTTAQLKTMQEVITLLVFAGFSIAYLKEALAWNHAIGFTLIAAGAFFVFSPRVSVIAPDQPPHEQASENQIHQTLEGTSHDQ
jgi:uncharacterized protein